MTITKTHTTAILTGTPLAAKDRAAIRSWRGSTQAGRGTRVDFMTDHEAFSEVAEVAIKAPGGPLGPTRIIVRMMFRERATGDAVVVDGEGLEIGRGASMVAALGRPGVALTQGGNQGR